MGPAHRCVYLLDFRMEFRGGGVNTYDESFVPHKSPLEPFHKRMSSQLLVPPVLALPVLVHSPHGHPHPVCRILLEHPVDEVPEVRVDGSTGRPFVFDVADAFGKVVRVLYTWPAFFGAEWLVGDVFVSNHLERERGKGVKSHHFACSHLENTTRQPPPIQMPPRLFIRLLPVLLPPFRRQKLGWRKMRRADPPPHPLLVLVHPARESKIRQHQIAVRAEEDVARLDVTVDEAEGVHEFEGEDEVRKVEADVGSGEPAGGGGGGSASWVEGGEEGGEGAAGSELGEEVEVAGV